MLDTNTETHMHILYTNPVDNIPRLREVNNYREAGAVIAALKLQGISPQITTPERLKEAKPTCLPLICSKWRGEDGLAFIQSRALSTIDEHLGSNIDCVV
jgi:hypothetical protein